MRNFSNIFQYHLNTGKHTCRSLAIKSGLSASRLQDFLHGQVLPDIGELSKLADALFIRPSDLMHAPSNSDKGIVFLSAADSAATCRDIYRRANNQRIRYYTYRDTAFSKTTPHARGVILDIRCTKEDDVVQNSGHFQDALTLVLKGAIKGYWSDGSDKSLSRVLEQGHSYYARGYIPHTYRSLAGHENGQILSFTFNQYISGDVQKELAQLGTKRARENILSNNPYGNLLACHLNNSMKTPNELAIVTGINESKIHDFLDSNVAPSSFEIDAIADALQVSVDELIPTVSDSDAGLRHMTFAESKATTRRLRGSNGSIRYEVRDLARTKEASIFRAHHIKVLSKRAAISDCDLFSTEHTLLFGVSGSAQFSWLHNEQFYQLIFNAYDSIYIEPFVRFTLSTDTAAQVVRFQYPSLMAGGARKEMMNKGVSSIERLVSEQHAWADNQDFD